MDNLITNPLNSLNSINPLNSLGSLSTLNPLNLNTSLLSKPTALEKTALVDNVVKTPATVTKTATSTVTGDTVTQTTKTVTETTKTDANSLDAAAKELNKKVEVNKKSIGEKKERSGMWRPWLIFVLLFILFMLTLGFSKASIVMTENDQRVVVVDWLKLIVWSLMLAAGFMIIALLIMKGAHNMKSNV